MNKIEIVEALVKRFPNIEVLSGSNFSEGYDDNQLWIRNASSVSYTKKDLNPLSALDNRIYFSKLYNLDVYHKFEKWCTKRGWYPTTEDYTLILIKIDE